MFPLCDDYFQWVTTAPSIAIARNDCTVGTPLYFNSTSIKAKNPLSYATETVIEIKQSYPGRMAWNPFIKSYRTCMVFPLSTDFLFENGPFRLKHKRNRQKSSKSIENKYTHCAIRLLLIGKHAQRVGNIRHVRSWSESHRK